MIDHQRLTYRKDTGALGQTQTYRQQQMSEFDTIWLISLSGQRAGVSNMNLKDERRNGTMHSFLRDEILSYQSSS